MTIRTSTSIIEVGKWLLYAVYVATAQKKEGRTPSQRSNRVQPTYHPQGAGRYKSIISNLLPVVKKGADKNAMTTDQRRALDMALFQIHCEFGKAAIAPGKYFPSQKVIPTGIHSLDAAMGGGIPSGRIVELHGGEATGKTSLALFLSGTIGGATLYIDADAALSTGSLVNACFPPEEMSAFYIARPETLEDALTIAYNAASAFDSIVIDSIPALPTKAELEGKKPAKDRTAAAILSRYLPRMIPRCKRTGTTVFLINQLRIDPETQQGNPNKPTGGRAIKCYSFLSLETQKGKLLRPSAGEDFTGQTCIVQCQKCKYAAPGRKATLQLTYCEGFQDYIAEGI